jgi:hypothetical protein
MRTSDQKISGNFRWHKLHYIPEKIAVKKDSHELSFFGEGIFVTYGGVAKTI